MTDLTEQIAAALELVRNSVQHGRNCQVGGLCICSHKTRAEKAVAAAVARAIQEVSRVVFTLTWTHEEWPEQGPSPTDEREILDQAIETGMDALRSPYEAP